MHNKFWQSTYNKSVDNLQETCLINTTQLTEETGNFKAFVSGHTFMNGMILSLIRPYHGFLFSNINNLVHVSIPLIVFTSFLYRQCAMNALLDVSQWFSHREGFVAVSLCQTAQPKMCKLQQFC